MRVSYTENSQTTLLCNFNVFAYPFGTYKCDMLVLVDKYSSPYVNMTPWVSDHYKTVDSAGSKDLFSCILTDITASTPSESEIRVTFHLKVRIV